MAVSGGVVVMCAAQACAQIGAFSVAAILPTLIAAWSLSNTEAGWLGGVYYAAYTVVVPVLSSLTDRVDARRVYLGSVALTTLAFAGFAWVATVVDRRETPRERGLERRPRRASNKTMHARGRRGRRPPWPLRVVRSRPRLFVSGAIGGAVGLALTVVPAWRGTTGVLLGWDLGTGLYLLLAFVMMARSDVHRIRRRAASQDEGQAAILVLTVAAALATLAAIFSELGAARSPLRVVLAVLTIGLSWAFIHTMFALHYAHEFYDETAGGGMAFPGTDAEPDYWDFVYFSFVVGMTSQVSDVAVTSKTVRRTVAAHGVVAFVFNVALLALTVNLAASAIEP